MINNKLSKISTLIRNKLYYGYPYRCDEDLPLILLSYADTSCYNKYEIKKYKDLLQKLTFDCIAYDQEVTIDNSNREAWEIANPACISRKQWERIAYKICYKYKLDIFIEKQVKDICNTSVEVETIKEDCITEFLIDALKDDCEVFIETSKKDTACNLAFDISKNILHCDVLTVISIQQKLCELNIFTTPVKEKCEAEYKLLIEKYPTCSLTKNQYIKLISRNYNYCGLSMIYNKGINFTVNEDSECISTSLDTYSTNKDLKFKDIVTKDMQIAIEIINDYNLNNKIKTKLTDAIYIL